MVRSDPKPYQTIRYRKLIKYVYLYGFTFLRICICETGEREGTNRERSDAR